MYSQLIVYTSRFVRVIDETIKKAYCLKQVSTSYLLHSLPCPVHRFIRKPNSCELEIQTSDRSSKRRAQDFPCDPELDALPSVALVARRNEEKLPHVRRLCRLPENPAEVGSGPQRMERQRHPEGGLAAFTVLIKGRDCSGWCRRPCKWCRR